MLLLIFKCEKVFYIIFNIKYVVKKLLKSLTHFYDRIVLFQNKRVNRFTLTYLFNK